MAQVVATTVVGGEGETRGGMGSAGGVGCGAVRGGEREWRGGTGGVEGRGQRGWAAWWEWRGGVSEEDG